jgi:hypothetical protein
MLSLALILKLAQRGLERGWPFLESSLMMDALQRLFVSNKKSIKNNFKPVDF